MDHFIEYFTLLSFKSQTYLGWLNDILWLLYRDLNVCSVMPMYDFFVVVGARSNRSFVDYSLC